MTYQEQLSKLDAKYAKFIDSSKNMDITKEVGALIGLVECYRIQAYFLLVDLAKLQEIKDAVDAGKTVHWASTAYVVIKGKYDYLIHCPSNDNYCGLTHKDEVTMNGKEEEFFIAKEKQ